MYNSSQNNSSQKSAGDLHPKSNLRCTGSLTHCQCIIASSSGLAGMPRSGAVLA